MSRAVVSLATERGNYYNSLARLANSLKGNFDGSFLGFMGEESVGASKHIESNYGFKIFAIEKAIENNFTSILWLDSSTYAIKNIEPIFKLIETDGYFMQEAGAWVGNWASDSVLKYFDITRDKAMEIPMYSAGYTGLNLYNKDVVSFFEEWKNCLFEGLFNGRWDNNDKTESDDVRCFGSRHDMTIASILAQKMGFKYQSGNNYIEYGAPEEQPKNETIVIKNQGI
jgi:hypothetical protein